MVKSYKIQTTSDPLPLHNLSWDSPTLIYLRNDLSSHAQLVPVIIWFRGQLRIKTSLFDTRARNSNLNQSLIMHDVSLTATE